MLIRQDGPTVTVWAPAKLNLFLKILGQRPDGYHEVVTLIVAVDRYDTLTLTPRDNAALTLACDWATVCAPHAANSFNRDPAGSARSALAVFGKSTLPVGSGLNDPLPPPEENLVYKALQLLQRDCGCERGAHVDLVKRIPPASGLGGGSSDAAAALMAGNRAWGLGYSREALVRLAAELGSDVPFFLHQSRGQGATLAVCRGRGERVEPAHAPAGLHFVIARPATGLSTADVYRRYKVSHAGATRIETPAAHEPKVDALLHALATGELSQAAANFTNDLQRAAAEVSPTIAALAHEFAQLEPIVHQMSGSGSAYFGWFRHAAHARRAAGRLRGRGFPHVWQVQTI